MVVTRFGCSSTAKDIRCVRLHLQSQTSVARSTQITVDNALPTSPEGELLCVSAGAAALTGLALVEKAVRIILFLARRCRG
jgi:hypothetical protein